MSQKSKHRECPALSRSITPVECASGRHSAIRCPASCPHNAFAPSAYDDLLDAETRLDKRSLSALGAKIGLARMASIRSPGRTIHGDHQTAVSAAVIRALFLERDSAGRGFAERWLAAGAAGLTNDERVLLAAKSRLRVALLEVREVRADGLLRMADLLDPRADETLLLDRATWARATRFQVLLVWSYSLPHYTRMFGGDLSWPDWKGLDLEPADALAEIVAHAGGPAVDAPRGGPPRMAGISLFECPRPHPVRFPRPPGGHAGQSRRGLGLGGVLLSSQSLHPARQSPEQLARPLRRGNPARGVRGRFRRRLGLVRHARAGRRKPRPAHPRTRPPQKKHLARRRPPAAPASPGCKPPSSPPPARRS